MTHDLKCDPKYFQDVVAGVKRFEIRKNDRDFKVGDTLILKEWCKRVDGRTDVYTGRQTARKVIYVADFRAGLKPGFVVLGIS